METAFTGILTIFTNFCTDLNNIDFVWGISFLQFLVGSAFFSLLIAIVKSIISSTRGVTRSVGKGINSYTNTMAKQYRQNGGH